MNQRQEILHLSIFFLGLFIIIYNHKWQIHFSFSTPATMKKTSKLLLPKTIKSTKEVSNYSISPSIKETLQKTTRINQKTRTDRQRSYEWSASRKGERVTYLRTYVKTKKRMESKGAILRTCTWQKIWNRKRVYFTLFRDRPRKAGGGYGNVGNIKDEQNTEKYVKEGEEPKST